MRTGPLIATAKRFKPMRRKDRHFARKSRSDRCVYKVQFTASQEYVDLLNEALDLLGHTKQASNLPEVQIRAMRAFVTPLRKRRTASRTASARVAEHEHVTVENLELRCKSHNTLAAEDDFGREHMNWARDLAHA